MKILIKSTIVLLCASLIESCREDAPSDQRLHCTSMNFSVVSKNSSEDLIFSPNPILSLYEDVFSCANFTMSDSGCSNDFPPRTIIEKKVIGDINVVSALLCEVSKLGEWSDYKIIIMDSLVYEIEYKQQDFDTFINTKPSENYFLELYINGELQCAPCEPDHVTIFEVDL